MALALSQFLVAVQNDQREEIRSYLAMLDQASANTCLEEVGTHYGLKTFWEPTAFDGWRVMLGQDLADVMYGTRDVSGVRRLLQRYGIDFIDIRASGYHVQTLRAYFGLAKTVSQVSFATWNHFLVAGMKGETSLARKVGAYLLEREREARISDMALQRPQSAIEQLRAGIIEVDTRVETGFNEVRGQLIVLEGGLQRTESIAVEAQHTALRTQKEMILYKRRQLKRAQSFLPGEFNAAIRAKLFEFAAFKCLRCQEIMTMEEGLSNSCEIDEVLPRAQGGNRTWDNVQALCRRCNQLRAQAAAKGIRVQWSWDFRDRFPTFKAACEREQRKYERRCEQDLEGLPLFS